MGLNGILRMALAAAEEEVKLRLSEELEDYMEVVEAVRTIPPPAVRAGRDS